MSVLSKSFVAQTNTSQVASRKSLLEIDLNENLKRRRGELRGKIERLREPQDEDSSSAEDLESRRRELRALNNSIEILTKKAQGLPFITSFSFLLTNIRRG
jgi:structural maintenance of chromosome 3 (chondroitin sulfate proteoglycan 6)